MTYLKEVSRKECALEQQALSSSALSSPALSSSAPLAQLLSHLPENDLAVFGHAPVRSRPYPQWPIFDERDILAVTQVVQSGQWGGAPFPGPQTAKFAEAFAEMQVNADHPRREEIKAVPMANGSITLEVALRAAQIGWGDEVIVPAYTFQATATAPIAAGAIPVIVDIDPDTYCISPTAIEAAITQKTRAIIPVHLGAQVADMDAIMAIAQKHNLVVIEDCAHAHGAQWNRQGVGTFGDFGSFSLQSSKILTAGEGGVLLCKNQALADRATSIINCGRLPQSKGEPEAIAVEVSSGVSPIDQLLRQFLQFSGQEPTFSLGTNYRMSEFQAAMGCVALERFEEQVCERAITLDYLESQLSEVPGIRLLKQDSRHTKRSFYRYIFAINPDLFGATHKEVCLALHAEGIPCTPGYTALHRCTLFQPTQSRLAVPNAYPEHFDYSQLSLPQSEKACEKEAVWLDESVFRAGQQGIDDVITALKKVQRSARILSAAKATFLSMVSAQGCM